MKELAMNIYVGNLPYSIKDDRLKELFSQYGEVEAAKVIMDRFDGRSKGYGFVEMPDNSEADQAIKQLNGKSIEGKSIKVNPANSRGKRSKKSSRRRGYF